MLFRAEFHVHTVLSPCADVEMIPPFIIQTASELGINLLAITDHNATANIEAVQKAAEGSGITVLPGIELQTREEVHLLALFDHLDQAYAFQKIVDVNLPDQPNDPEHFGEQFVVDATGDFIRREERLLINSTHLELGEAVKNVHQNGGLAIPAHINRKAFGMIEVLGFIPPQVAFDAVEVSRHVDISKFLSSQRLPIRQSVIQSGDVHRLDEFMGRNYFEIEKPSLSEITMALKHINGRKFWIGNSN